MDRRGIEMFQYRQVLVQLRQGDSESENARSRLMGQPKAPSFRAVAARMGWLDPQAPLATVAEIAAASGSARPARSTISSADVHRALVVLGRRRRLPASSSMQRCAASTATAVVLSS
jgi:hypothetical protein